MDLKWLNLSRNTNLKMEFEISITNEVHMEMKYSGIMTAVGEKLSRFDYA